MKAQCWFGIKYNVSLWYCRCRTNCFMVLEQWNGNVLKCRHRCVIKSMRVEKGNTRWEMQRFCITFEINQKKNLLQFKKSQKRKWTNTIFKVRNIASALFLSVVVEINRNICWRTTDTTTGRSSWRKLQRRRQLWHRIEYTVYPADIAQIFPRQNWF